MEDDLCRFHTFKDVFLLGQDGKKVNAKGNALRTELVEERKVDVETNAEIWTHSKKRRDMNDWRDYISHGNDVSKELDADFNLQRIHLMSHWVEQICRYGALQQYSSMRHEQAHITNIRDGWNASNHNLNYLQQVSPFSIAFSASKSESSISKPSSSVERSVLPPAKSSLPVLIWLPPGAPSHLQSPNSWYPKTAMMESILTL